MGYKTPLLAALLLVQVGSSFAGETGDVGETTPSGMFSHLDLNFLASYTDFNFNSREGVNFNHFKGFSKQLSLGAGNVALSKTITAGLAILTGETKVKSTVFLDPGNLGGANQTIKNNTLFGHVLKNVYNYTFVDVAGGYGRNRITNHSAINPNTEDQQFAFANSHSTNWFGSLSGIYSRPWKNIIFTSNVRLLYSNSSSDGYNLQFQAPDFISAVLPLTTKVWYSMENVEIATNLAPTNNVITPFVNAGLVQVLSFSNSRPILASSVNGISPQLNLNKGGFRLGGGFTTHIKKLSIRLEEQYYNSVNTYISYQTLLSFRYLI